MSKQPNGMVSLTMLTPEPLHPVTKSPWKLAPCGLLGGSLIMLGAIHYFTQNKHKMMMVKMSVIEYKCFSKTLLFQLRIRVIV